MSDEVRGTVESVGANGASGTAVARIVKMPDGQPADPSILAVVLATALAAHESSHSGASTRGRARSWKQVGRLEAMGTDAERRNGLR